jgi:hypothetical protein
MANDLDRYIKKLDIVVKKHNSKYYNLQAVASMFGLDPKENKNAICANIVSYLHSKRDTNKYINYLLTNITDEDNLCDTLIASLYELFTPSNLPEKSPIKITEKLYRELIEKQKTNTISSDEKIELDEALQAKYCMCQKKLYSQYLFKKNILEQEPKYSPYATCLSSIYKKRGIAIPKGITRSCAAKFPSWYN